MSIISGVFFRRFERILFFDVFHLAPLIQTNTGKQSFMFKNAAFLKRNQTFFFFLQERTGFPARFNFSCSWLARRSQIYCSEKARSKSPMEEIAKNNYSDNSLQHYIAL